MCRSKVYLMIVGLCFLAGIANAANEATDPFPVDGQEGIETANRLLKWTAGDIAVSHNVYLGTDPSLLEQVGTVSGSVLVLAGRYDANQQYYWRVDAVDAGGVVAEGAVWSFVTEMKQARDPEPADGAEGVIVVNPELQWTNGDNSILHYVYFGTDRDAIDHADMDSPEFKDVILYGDTFEAGSLRGLTTYYWRVDEQDYFGDVTKGTVWNFTTELAIPVIEDMLGWYKCDEYTGQVLDWSGHSNHGTLVDGARIVEGLMGGAAAVSMSLDYLEIPNFETDDLNEGAIMCWIKPEGPQVAGARIVFHQGWQSNRQGLWLESGQRLRHDYKNKFYRWNTDLVVTSDEWQHIGSTMSVANNEGRVWIDGQSVKIDPVPGDTEYEYIPYRYDGPPTRVGAYPSGKDDQQFNGLVDDIRFYTRWISEEEVAATQAIPAGMASNPTPSVGIVLGRDELPTTLSWTAGQAAVNNQLYISTEMQDHFDGVDPVLTTTETSVAAPITLELGKEYFWRVDAVAADGTVTRGALWAFSSTKYQIIDNFEDYVDGDNPLWNSWLDGWDDAAGNGTGALIGDETTQSTTEEATVYAGSQAFPLAFNNTGATATGSTRAMYSETERALETMDLIRDGATKLTVYFHGSRSNEPVATDKLYVVLEDTLGNDAVIVYDDEQALTEAFWHEWTIEFSEFSGEGVMLDRIAKIYIGVGDRNNPVAGSSGKVVIDEIKLNGD